MPKSDDPFITALWDSLVGAKLGPAGVVRARKCVARKR